MRALIAILLLTAPPGTADARQVPPMTLAEHVRVAPLIVVASIESTDGRKDSGIGGVRYLWDSELKVSEVLKGSPPKPLIIRWEETHMDGVPAYAAGTKMIWLLMKNEKTGSFYAFRFDSIQPLSRRKEILRAIKKGAP